MKIQIACLIIAGLAVTGMTGMRGQTQNHRLVAHEWGTFTSVQGADGVLLDWKPLETSKLPKFVYDWTHPGLNRVFTGGGYGGFGKGSMIARQRMETPVIYFYSDREQTVDVTVLFPRGLITEWFPQARRIGPSIVPPGQGIAAMDSELRALGVSPRFTLASLFESENVGGSMIRWADVKILPTPHHTGIAAQLPTDDSGSHYFAARDTDAAFVSADSFSRTNRLPEHEKFLFYRGVGNFSTPLRVTMKSDDAVMVTNTGTEPLAHLFVLGVKGMAGNFVYIDELLPGTEKTIPLGPQNQPLPGAVLNAELGRKLAESLVKEGLYPREAAAMVNTWKDSWFAEDGVRVLYLLPRAWTDQTLPLTLDPAPREVVRVMVGRAEVLSPGVEQTLADSLAKARTGDEQARMEVISQFKKLGRFGEPALRLATKGASMELAQSAWTLFQTASAASKGDPSKPESSL